MHTFVRTMAAVAVLTVLSSDAAAQDQQASIEDMLIGRSASEAVDMLSAKVDAQPDDGQSRFALGIAQFLRSQEALMQALHAYGCLEPIRMSMMMVSPGPATQVPTNQEPKEIDHDALLGIVETWLSNVAEAQETLAKVEGDDVKLRVQVGLIRLDINGDGTATEDEALWKFFAAQTRQQLTLDDVEQFDIAFDRGDVNWLRGYCHLLMAAGNAALAYDTSEIFDRTAHLFFARPKTTYAYMANKPTPDQAQGEMIGNLLDLVAFVHLLNFEVKDAARLQTSLEHLHAMLKNAREMWTHYHNETDNDREWIPTPAQDSIFPNTDVDQPMYEAWMAFLDEAEEVLRGERLLPFWREAGGRGINLRRVFTEPSTFDLVLWVQGTAAHPYLEEGPHMSEETIRQLQQAFGHRAFDYAAWFN